MPRLRDSYNLPAIVHKTLLVQGIPESHLARSLERFEDQLPSPVKLAYLPSPGRVRLRLTGRGEDLEDVKSLIQEHFGNSGHTDAADTDKMQLFNPKQHNA